MGFLVGEAIVPLNAALRDANDNIRLMAASALARVGAAAVKPLLIALSDADKYVRWHAATALGKIGDPRAVPELEHIAMTDKDKTLRGLVADAAREAVRQIHLKQMMARKK